MPDDLPDPLPAPAPTPQATPSSNVPGSDGWSDMSKLRMMLLGSGAATLGGMALLNWKLRDSLHKTRTMQRKELPGIYQHAGLDPRFPTFAVPGYGNAGYASAGEDARDEARELPGYSALRKKDPGLDRKLKDQGYILYDPHYAKPGVLAHEAGHARLEARPPEGILDHLSRFNQRWLRPASSVASLVAPALALAASRWAPSPGMGALAGLGIGTAAALPTLINEYQASRHAFDYLDQSKLTPAQKSKNKRALTMAYLTYLTGSLAAPTLTGAGGGWYHSQKGQQEPPRPPRVGMEESGVKEARASLTPARLLRCLGLAKRADLVKAAFSLRPMLRGISGVMPKVTTGRLTGLAAAGAGSYGGYKAYHSPGLADAYHTVGDLLSPEGREAMALEATNRHLSTHDPAGMSQSPALPYGSGPNAQLRGEQRAMTSRIGQSAVKKMIPEDLATTVNDKIEAEAKPRIEAHLKALQDKAQKYLAGGISGLSQQAGEGLAGQLSRPGVVAGALGGGALLGGLAGGGGHSGLSGRLRSGLIGGLTAGGGLAGAGLAQHFLPQYGLGGMLGGAALGAVGSNLLGRLVPGGSPSAKRRLPDDEEDD